MYSVASHDHGRVLGIGQESHVPWIGDSVNAAQFNIDLKANVCEVLWFGLPAFEALQALGCYSGLKGAVGQGEKM